MCSINLAIYSRRFMYEFLVEQTRGHFGDYEINFMTTAAFGKFNMCNDFEIENYFLFESILRN